MYIDQPKGFVKVGEEDKVYRIRKVLYGLKQAPRAWFSRIEWYFKREGFQKSSYNHTLFLKKSETTMLVVSLYVDDLIFTTSDERTFVDFKTSMQKEFEMTDMGKMKFFLGVKVNQGNDGIYISVRRSMPKKCWKGSIWRTATLFKIQLFQGL